jgi:HlyD family secretion protein
MDGQHRANRTAYADALAQERAAVTRIEQELRAASAVLVKLQRTVPIYRTMAERYATLRAEGFVSELYALERQRDRIEKEQDEDAQRHTVESLEANRAQAQRRLAQVESSYRQQLHAERTQVASQRARIEEDLAKALYRASAVELRAPQAGVVKDLATHTLGTVVSPGTVLLTLVPAGEELQADVLVRNLDVGFVHVGQTAKVKVATYPFQKYGTVQGVVTHVSADASEAPTRRDPAEESAASAQNGYRARVALAAQSVSFDGRSLPLTSGMQVESEIRLGERSLLEYVLAPFQKAWHEAARER